MREIKFRAWFDNAKLMIYSNEIARYGVNPFSATHKATCFVSQNVMQFTGLLDKDGKEIYEGDIVKYDTEDGTVTSKVIFREDKDETLCLTGFFFEPIRFEEYEESREPIELIIIGNLYENPELLKEANRQSMSILYPLP